MAITESMVRPLGFRVEGFRVQGLGFGIPAWLSQNWLVLQYAFSGLGVKGLEPLVRPRCAF